MGFDAIAREKGILTVMIGREIPEEVAAKTDRDNEFPMEMWRKFGEAGYMRSLRIKRII